MFFQRIFTPGLAINSYLLGDDVTKTCVVIDPTRHTVPYIMQTQNAELEISAILETHVHADFVSGAKELKHQLNGKPRIYASGMGGEKWIPAYADEVVRQDTQLKIGSLRLAALHTPGHTAEHLAWICYDDSRCTSAPWFAFTGDSVFVGSIGRPDLMGEGNTADLASRLYQTLFGALATLPDFVEIFPCHSKGSLCGKALKEMPSSTMGYERFFNPYFRKESEERWIAHVLEEPPPIPPYFSRVKQMNLEGPPLLSTLKMTSWKEKGECPPLDDLFLVDIRHPELFSSSHITGSLNLPFYSAFAQWAGWLLPFERSIGLIVDNAHVAAEGQDQLRLLGFDQEIWILVWEEVCRKAPLSCASLATMEVDELKRVSESAPARWVFLDVRTREEWKEGHLAGARHIPLWELEHSIDALPRDLSIALLCRSGYRASMAASLLEKKGFSALFNVRGGMLAWKRSGFPLHKEQ